MISPYIFNSDGTVWKFESRFSFRVSSSQNRGFGFKKKCKKILFFKLKIETAVSVFGFGL